MGLTYSKDENMQLVVFGRDEKGENFSTFISKGKLDTSNFKVKACKSL
jgi:hypothetical protein